MLVLDPQAAGTLLCRRLCRRDRGIVARARGYFRDAELQFRSRPSITFTARWLTLSRCDSAPADSEQQHWEALAAITSNSKSGRRTARRISRTAPPCSAQRSHALKAANSTPSASTNRPSARRGRTALFTTRRSPTNCRALLRGAGFGGYRAYVSAEGALPVSGWGADGKVRQLDELYPHIGQEEPAPGPMSTIEAPVEHLDLATVIKVSQAVSGEIVLDKLIDTLMRTAIEQAGAERGLLILTRGAEQRIAAEANTAGDTRDRAFAGRGRNRDAAAGVGAPLCHTHPGEPHSRRRRRPNLRSPRTRTSVNAKLAHSVPAIDQSGQAHRYTLPREQPDAAASSRLLGLRF